MRTPPAHSDVVAHLRRAFGPETLTSDTVMRWWIHGSGPRSGVALWLRSVPPEADECCEVWVTRPDESQPERCPVTTLRHLDQFIARVKTVTRAAVPVAVHGNVCPPGNPAAA